MPVVLELTFITHTVRYQLPIYNIPVFGISPEAVVVNPTDSEVFSAPLTTTAYNERYLGLVHMYLL